MALTFCFLCYDGTDTLDATHEYSAGDTTGTRSSSAVYDAAIKFTGSYSLDCPSASDNITFASASIWDNGASYQNVVAFAFYIETWVDVAIICSFYQAAATNNHFMVRMAGTSGTGNLSLRTSVSGVGSTTVTLTGNHIALSTWYFCIARTDKGNTTIRLELYDATGSPLDSAENTGVTATHFPTTIDTIAFGGIGGYATNLHEDSFFVANAYNEAIEDYLDITSYTQYGAGGGNSNMLFQNQANSV
jgi:hypothetical protein